MNFSSRSNELLNHADRKSQCARFISATFWLAAYGGAIGIVWFICYIHPLGGPP